MSRIVATSIFHTAVVERSWKTQVTSLAVHGVVIGAAFLITVPVVVQMQRPSEGHVTLVAPYVPRPHAVIEAPHLRRVAKLTAPVPAPVIKPPVEIAKVIPPPMVPKVAPTPEVRPETKIQPRIEAENRPSAPAPKPAALLESQSAKAPPIPKAVVVGGFGDPRALQASQAAKAPVLMARVGAFDSPTGLSQSGGGGHFDSGAIKQSGFGNAGVSNGSADGSGKTAHIQTGGFGDSAVATRGNAGTVRSTGFGDGAAAAAPQQRTAAAPVVAAFTPVEILFKPRPAYSTEARGLHLEGQVSIEVVFQASGAVKVVRVIKGLGHGLDEAAEQAAQQVRFKPATRGGAPVDTSATISINFELT